MEFNILKFCKEKKHEVLIFVSFFIYFFIWHNLNFNYVEINNNSLTVAIKIYSFVPYASLFLDNIFQNIVVKNFLGNIFFPAAVSLVLFIIFKKITSSNFWAYSLTLLSMSSNENYPFINFLKGIIEFQNINELVNKYENFEIIGFPIPSFSILYFSILFFYSFSLVKFDGLKISKDDLVGNVVNMREFFRADSASKELEKTDRNRWGMTPQTVNAYYNSSFNEIVFPAAILQPPFFDPNADAAVNYGAIGAVIGHEMGHGFDDQGSKSDAEGIQRNWWTDEDRAAFDAKADKLAAQYSKYEPIPENFVNGRNSLGENIGDVGGLAMAYHAYKLSLNGKEAPVIDGVTGDQRFFLAWAQVWKEKRTEQSMLNQLRAGTHAPGQFRALAPRNHDAWYKAFDVKPGDALYLAEDERVRIW